MKKVILGLVAVLGLSTVQAQELPAPSPKAMVMQTVGLTEVTVEYSSPGVKGRKVFGDLVPFDQLWRTGANMATKITFSQDVMINDKEVKAGTYSIFSIPGKEEWTFILNSDWNQGGTGSYDKEKDILRMKVKPAKIENRERLAFMINDFDNDGGNLVMEWADVQISVPFKVHTAKQAEENIKNTTSRTWRIYANSARYHLDNDGNLDEALKLIEQSITLEEGWYNTWIKAQILAKQGKKKDALKAAKKAHELGSKPGVNYFYKDAVEKALKDWK